MMTMTLYGIGAKACAVVTELKMQYREKSI